MPRTKRQQVKTWCATDIMAGVRDASWILCLGDAVDGLRDGDHMLVDLSLKKPKDGDFVVYEKSPNEYAIHDYDSDYEYEGVVWGIGVAIVRKFNRKAKRRKSASPTDKERQAELARLRSKLSKLELLPENEAVRFKLESEIHKLERQDSEWPDMIGEVN